MSTVGVSVRISAAKKLKRQLDRELPYSHVVISELTAQEPSYCVVFITSDATIDEIAQLLVGTEVWEVE